MFRIIRVLVLSVISSALMTFVAQATTAKNAPKKPQNSELIRCVYTPQSDSQSSSLPTTKIGFKFSLLKNNNYEIAADTYTLNDSSQLIKQIGHAELVSSLANISESSSVAQIFATLTISEDSPFDFAATLSNVSAADSEGRFSGTVNSVATFTGTTYTEVPVSCKILKAVNSASSASSSTTTSTSDVQN